MIVGSDVRSFVFAVGLTSFGEVVGERSLGFVGRPVLPLSVGCVVGSLDAALIFEFEGLDFNVGEVEGIDVGCDVGWNERIIRGWSNVGGEGNVNKLGA